jgi:hypothetical protein
MDEGQKRKQFDKVSLKRSFWLHEYVTEQFKVLPSLRRGAVLVPHMRSRWCACCLRVSPEIEWGREGGWRESATEKENESKSKIKY